MTEFWAKNACTYMGAQSILESVCEERKERKGWRGKDRDKSSCFRLGRKEKDCEERNGRTARK